jgi:ATP-dependent DNA helicase 2 subunit 1
VVAELPSYIVHRNRDIQFLEMAPYDDWNRLDEEEDQELEDTSVRVLGYTVVSDSANDYTSCFQFYDARKDIILFAIDCSSSMLELRDDPAYEDGEVKTW